MHSFWCLLSHAVGSERGLIKEFEPKGSFEIPIDATEHWGPRVLPWYPIWIGLLVNTLFYATIVWLLSLGPFALRIMIHRKRGFCINCAYDLKGAAHAACPECGATVGKAAPA